MRYTSCVRSTGEMVAAVKVKLAYVARIRVKRASELAVHVIISRGIARGTFVEASYYDREAYARNWSPTLETVLSLKEFKS
jgi:hypothetical protein